MQVPLLLKVMAPKVAVGFEPIERSLERLWICGAPAPDDPPTPEPPRICVAQ